MKYYVDSGRKMYNFKFIIFWKMARISIVILLSGCGEESRFDNAKFIDVCGIISQAEAEHLLGSFVEEPTSEKMSGGAGNCKWSFPDRGGKNTATIYVSILTEGANGERQNLGQWFDISLGEIRASIGEPLEIKNLGTKAYLFQGLNRDNTAILMQQGKTYVHLNSRGISASLLYTFAQILSRELKSKK